MLFETNTLPRHHLLSCLAVFCFAACSGNGGVGDETRRVGSGKIGAINVYNARQVFGTTVAESVVPLYQGGYSEVPNLITSEGEPCQVFAMGPRFPDGTLRYLRVEFVTSAEPGQLKTVGLEKFGSKLDFRHHPSVQGKIGVNARMRVGASVVAFPDPELIEEGPVTEVYRSRLRDANSMIWAELTVSIYTNLPHAKFILQWGNCHPGKSALSEDPGRVEFQYAGPVAQFENASKVLDSGRSGGYDFVGLHQGGTIGDGQSQVVEGRFIYSGGTTPPRLFAIADNWDHAKAYGPFGEVVREIKVDPADFLNQIRSEETQLVDHPWGRGLHGCNPNPSNTGTQPDFGTIKMRADVLLADPRRLPIITRSVYQEACRPTHFRELDVSPVRVANHPNLLTLDGRPKGSESIDLLGKERNGASFTTMKGPSGSRWRGHDVEHLSINYLAGLAMLTGNRFARQEVENHAMLYLTGFTHESGSWNDSPGPARKIGRSALAAIWIWMVTGREDVKQRVIDRTDDVLRQVSTNNTNLIVISPRGTYWVPWEEGIALAGLGAVYRNFGTVSALQVLAPVCKTVTINGFGRLSNGEWRCGYHSPWYLGSTNYSAMRDPNFDNTAAGGGLTIWAVPAVFIAAELHPEEFTRERAKLILRGMYERPIHGMEEHLEWIGVSRKVSRLANMSSQY